MEEATLLSNNTMEEGADETTSSLLLEHCVLIGSSALFHLSGERLGANKRDRVLWCVCNADDVAQSATKHSTANSATAPPPATWTLWLRPPASRRIPTPVRLTVFCCRPRLLLLSSSSASVVVFCFCRRLLPKDSAAACCSCSHHTPPHFPPCSLE